MHQTNTSEMEQGERHGFWFMKEQEPLVAAVPRHTKVPCLYRGEMVSHHLGLFGSIQLMQVQQAAGGEAKVTLKCLYAVPSWHEDVVLWERPRGLWLPRLMRDDSLSFSCTLNGSVNFPMWICCCHCCAPRLTHSRCIDPAPQARRSCWCISSEWSMLSASRNGHPPAGRTITGVPQPCLTTQPWDCLNTLSISHLNRVWLSAPSVVPKWHIHCTKWRGDGYNGRRLKHQQVDIIKGKQKGRMGSACWTQVVYLENAFLSLKKDYQKKEPRSQ